MGYQRTQIYLDPDEHRRLVREAAERGISLAAYMREIVANRAGEQDAPHDTRSWDNFIGAISAGAVRYDDDPDAEVAEAIEWNYRRKMGEIAEDDR
ncbi:MAG: CopG family transcriptional regulator [Actinomycetota bacterium]